MQPQYLSMRQRGRDSPPHSWPGGWSHCQAGASCAPPGLPGHETAPIPACRKSTATSQGSAARRPPGLGRRKGLVLRGDTRYYRTEAVQPRGRSRHKAGAACAELVVRHEHLAVMQVDPAV